MKQCSVPVVDPFFNLETALTEMGFDFNEKDNGRVIAFGYIDDLDRDITIEYNATFISNYQFDMMITSDKDGQQDVLYLGLAPTNQHDFDMLMHLLMPSDEYRERIESVRLDKELLRNL